MKLKIYYALIVFSLSLFAQTSQAQCDGLRYRTSVFSDYNFTTVTYSTVYNLQMDIYAPRADTFTARPLIVLAHGGTFITGTRSDDSTIVYLCQNFAKRGYVTCSIDYRLANPLNLLDSSKMIDEVIKSISDAKAAVRYFYKDAYGANLYRLDTNKIFIGGNSAGAVLAMHYGYLISLSQVPADLDTIINQNGGIDGNSGNPGYSSKAAGVVNLAGGLNIPELIVPGSLPVVSAQGDQDSVVPYICNYPTIDEPQPIGPVSIPVRLCGLGSLQPLITANTTANASIVFPGDGHVPWAFDTAKFNRVDTLTTGFLYPLVCSTPAGINSISQDADISLFPNPATNLVSIHSTQLLHSIFMYDQTGREVMQVSHVNDFEYKMNTSALAKGMYLVKFTSGQSLSPTIKKIVVE